MGDIALPGVINQHVGAAETRGDRVSEGLNFRFIQYVAAPRTPRLLDIRFATPHGRWPADPGCGRKGDLRPFAQQQAQRFKADPDEPPVTTATRPSIVHSSRTSSPMRKSC